MSSPTNDIKRQIEEAKQTSVAQINATPTPDAVKIRVIALEEWFAKTTAMGLDVLKRG